MASHRMGKHSSSRECLLALVFVYHLSSAQRGNWSFDNGPTLHQPSGLWGTSFDIQISILNSTMNSTCYAFPPITEKLQYVQASLRPWKTFLASPSVTKSPPFNEWMWQRFLANDLPSLYGAMLATVDSVVSQRGVSRSEPKLALFASLSYSLSLVRLRRAYVSASRPRWFARAWKLIPPTLRLAITLKDKVQFAAYLDLIQAPGTGSCVYGILCESGTYVGKANLRRAVPGRPNGWQRGIGARFGEHLAGLLFPASRDGAIARYTLLRKSIGSVSMLPLMSCVNEHQALALERVVIQTADPLCNGADLSQFLRSKGKLLKPLKAGRHRPPKHARRASGSNASVWLMPQFQIGVSKQLNRSLEGPSQAVPKLPFKALYRHLQAAMAGASGCIGPIPILGKAHLPLFVAFCAIRKPRLWFPTGWHSPTLAQQIYMAADEVDARLPCFGMRIAARRALEQVLRRAKLPPLCVRPLCIHPALLPRLPAIRNLVRSSLILIKNRPAREWLDRHLRVIPGKRRKWQDKINAKQALRGIGRPTLLGMTKEEFSASVSLQSMAAFPGPWRLPQWPSWTTVHKDFVGVWRQWSQGHRLPKQAVYKGRGVMESWFAGYSQPVAPSLWQVAEAKLKEVVRRPGCVIRDDKDSTKVWVADPVELACSTLAGIAADPIWKVHVGMQPSSVQIVGYSKVALGVPWFLKRRFGSGLEKTQPTWLFPLVKSKCYRDDGSRSCGKPNHSCFRRVLDTSLAPGSMAWRILGRGIRFVVSSLGGKELFDPLLMGTKVSSLLDALAPSKTGFCRCCGAELCGLQVFVGDVDQAFESCTGENVSAAWAVVSSCFQRRFQESFVQVKKGKTYQARLGSRGWSRGWWAFNISQLGQALHAAASGSFGCIAGVVVELLGMSIGGAMSSSAVSVRFAAEEMFGFHSAWASTAGLAAADESVLDWLRYVDDVLAMSYQVCSGCLGKFVDHMFDEPISPVFVSKKDVPAQFTWLQADFFLTGYKLAWTLKNGNRDAIFCKTGGPFKPQFLPWPGSLPVFFKQLRGVLISKAVVCRAMGVSVAIAASAILEALLELIRLEYPLSLIRALVHSLPRSRASLLARSVVRLHIRFVGNMGRGNGSKGSGSGQGGGHGGSGNGGGFSRRDDDRDRDRDRDRGRDEKKSRGRDRGGKERRSSKKQRKSSSSSSSASSRGKKMKTARKTLSKHDSEYRNFLEDKEKRAMEDHYRQQGELLATALSEKFDASIAAAAQAGAKQTAAAGLAQIPRPDGTIMRDFVFSTDLQRFGSSSGSVEAQQPSGGGVGASQNPSEGFTPGQLDQIRQLLTDSKPDPSKVIGAGGSKSGNGGSASTKPEDSSLSQLQLALCNSMFLGKVILKETEGLSELKERIEANWSNRSIVQALDGFITDHGPAGTKVPKGKGDRVKIYWEILSNLS